MDEKRMAGVDTVAALQGLMYEFLDMLQGADSEQQETLLREIRRIRELIIFWEEMKEKEMAE